LERRRGSALSLKSIQQKRDFEKNRKKIIDTDDPDKLPKNNFTQEQLNKEWFEFGKRMNKKGEHIIGSIITMNKPLLKSGFILELIVPSETIKIDIISFSSELLKFLKETLNNYSINLDIKVNEKAATKHVFTPQEKYNKLKEINPLLEVFRNKLDLDL